MTAARVRPAAVSCSWTDWPTAASAGAEPDDFGVLVGDDGLEGGDAAVLLFVEGALEHLDPHGVGRRLDGGRGEEAFAAQVGFDVVEADPSTVTRVGLGLGVQARMDEPLALTRPCNGLPDTAGADTTGRLVGNRLADAMAHYEHLLGVMILTDDDVEAKQGVTLSREFPADEHRPIPKLFFDQRHRSPRSVANREFLVRKAVELLRAAGARTVRRMNWPPFIFHPHSTMRMGLDAANSVCDQNGAAPGVRHLTPTTPSSPTPSAAPTRRSPPRRWRPALRRRSSRSSPAAGRGLGGRVRCARSTPSSPGWYTTRNPVGELRAEHIAAPLVMSSKLRSQPERLIPPGRKNSVVRIDGKNRAPIDGSAPIAQAPGSLGKPRFRNRYAS